MGAEGTERSEAVAPEGVKHPIVEKDGIKFYEIKRYTNSGEEYLSYQPVDGPPVGHGLVDVGSERIQAAAALGREAAMQRKARRASEYEEKVYEQLDNVAKLQSYLISVALDSGAELDRSEMEKLRLGLQAGESILNRALGKAVTKIDADVRHSVADEIAEIEAEWVTEE
jgi:hypothetical protein